MAENYWDELMGTDEGAATYMDSYGEGPGSETRQIISNFINDGESVLDVGCGPGWNLDHFIEHGPRIHYKGTDYSQRFVKVANERAHKKFPDIFPEDEHGPFEMGDVRDIWELDKSWDVVLMQDVLEHTNGYEKPVREAIRVAKKRVIVTFWRTFNSKDEHDINDDGKDGYGATYSAKLWYDFLESLPYSWTETETSEKANRWHKYFIIYVDKEAEQL